MTIEEEVVNDEFEETEDQVGQETVDEDTAPETKERAPETPEAKVARLKRQLAREERKLNTSPEPKQETKSGDLDYGQKAYLVANGIKGTDEINLVKQIMKDTGKDLDSIIESRYFQAELKEMRDDKATKEAVPTNTKRSGNSARSSVEYWLAKGELPPEDQPELRRQVVNAEIKAQSTANNFTKNSVVMG